MTNLTKYSNREEMIVQSSWDILSENTKASYKSDLDIFFDFVQKGLTDINQKDIIDFVHFLQSKNYKNATINRKIASVSKLFTVYMIAGVILANPVDLARKSGKLTFRIVKSSRSFLTLQNVRDCVKASHTSTSDRDISLMVKLFAETGIRVSELINIKLNDITDIDKKYVNIHILGKGNVERNRPAPRAFIEKLKKIYSHETYLFCTVHRKKYHRSWAYAVLRKRFKRVCGLEKIGPHKLRHFWATYKIVVEKMDINAVSKALGHSSTSITLDMYVQSSLSAKESVVGV